MYWVYYFVPQVISSVPWIFHSCTSTGFIVAAVPGNLFITGHVNVFKIRDSIDFQPILSVKIFVAHKALLVLVSAAISQQNCKEQIFACLWICFWWLEIQMCWKYMCFLEWVHSDGKSSQSPVKLCLPNLAKLWYIASLKCFWSQIIPNLLFAAITKYWSSTVHGCPWIYLPVHLVIWQNAGLGKKEKL